MPLLSHLEIINAACARIGEEPVQTLDEDVSGSMSAGMLYEEVLDFALGVYPFTWASEVRQLSRDDTAKPLTGWTFVYDLPPERLGPPMYITDNASDPRRRFDRYTLSGPQVHSDAPALCAKIKFRPDPIRWPTTFRSVIISALAGRLAYALATDKQTANELTLEAFGNPTVDYYRGGMMRAAINEDAFATPPRRQDRDRNPMTSAWRS